MKAVKSSFEVFYNIKSNLTGSIMNVKAKTPADAIKTAKQRGYKVSDIELVEVVSTQDKSRKRKY